jgi:hypothetical protein
MRPFCGCLLGLALVAALGGLSACGGGGTPTDQLNGQIGAGAGGTAPTPASLMQLALTKPDGGVIGSLSYDTTLLSFSQPDPTQVGVLSVTGTNGFSITMTHISGRPDTPCRFEAAVLARDDGYDIGDTGYVNNALNQQFYQVNLSKSGGYVRLFCTELTGNAGVQFTIAADSAADVQLRQIYAVMNSVN